MWRYIVAMIERGPGGGRRTAAVGIRLMLAVEAFGGCGDDCGERGGTCI